MKYPIHTTYSCPKVREMPPVTATALKNYTADVLEQVSKHGAVAITRHDKPRAVLIPIELYEQLTGGGDDWLAELKMEYMGLLEEMQDPVQKAGAERAFNATPEELSRAAVAPVKNKKAPR